MCIVYIQAQQEADKNKKKLDKKKEADELSTLFKPVQTVSKGRINKKHNYIFLISHALLLELAYVLEI